MKPPAKQSPDRDLNSACGEKLTLLARRHPSIQHAAEALDLLRLSEEYAACWYEADDDEERRRLWKEYRHQVRITLTWKLSFHAAFGGAIHLAIMDPGYIILMVVMLYGCMHWLSR